MDACCSGAYRGDWYSPHGDRLPFPGDSADINQSSKAQKVYLGCRNSAISPVGCDIPTIAVYDDAI